MTKTAIDPYYFEKLDENFNEFMSDYDVCRRTDLIFNRLLPHCNVPSGACVLEIGCGTGKISPEISKHPWNLTVNYISAKLCQHVADVLGCKCLPGDCQQLECKEGAYDLIIYNVLRNSDSKNRKIDSLRKMS